MKVVIAGPGAFGKRHLDAIRHIDGVEVVSVVGRRMEPTQRVADHYGVPQATTDLADALAPPGVEAAILCTPTQLHAQQAIQCMDAGKHVLVEIPLADSLADAKAVYDKSKETGLVCMAGHTRRFSRPHHWLNDRIRAGELSIQQMDVQTYSLRRRNINVEGDPQSWTDNLLWHHAAHTVDLFQYQTGERVVVANAVQGPLHPELGIAMDMSVQLKSESGRICTLSLSFNNNGPIGSFFRYICNDNTYVARHENLVDGHENPIDVTSVDVSMDSIELQDREFFAAIAQGREPGSSAAKVMACYQTLHDLERSLS